MAKILVIDDEQAIIDMLTLRLERVGGYQVVSAGDGVSGLKAVKEHNPDLVLADVMMPNMDGIEFLTQLRKEMATLPVIILTASVSADVGNRIKKAGATDYLIKPFDAKILMEKIGRYIKHD
jgi:CheY-like chemotaxis protein